MARRLLPALATALLLAALAGVGCKGNLDEIVAGVNARATQAASGATLPVNEGTLGAVLGGATPTPEGATPLPDAYYDLSTDPAATLAHAWGQVYALSSGTEFNIIATQQQVGDFVIQRLQVSGWDRTARGGSATIAAGQVRLDLALEDTEGAFGAGVVTFQPTLDQVARLRLNPQGASFNSLRMPDNFTPAIGDAVYASLAGAPNAALSKVTLTRLTLENGLLDVAGTVR